MLKVNLFISECSDYQNLQSLKEKLKSDPEFYSRCAAILGPNQPGITQRDPSFTGAQLVHERSVAKSREKQRTPDAPKAPTTPPAATDEPTKKEIDKARREAEKLHNQLEDTLGVDLPEIPATPGLPQLPALPSGASSADAEQLLDFLLSP
jgi:hypothetical protein